MRNDSISLDVSRLENVKHLDGGGIRAACPACREAGSDKSGDHLLIQPSGKFGRAANPRDGEHRKRIFGLAGNRSAPGPAKNGNGTRFDCAYDYRDATGTLSFQIVRLKNPKKFYQRRPDDNGGWINNINGVERVLFRLPEIISAVSTNKLVFLCEGEKDVLAMVQHGFNATCNPGGAGKWQHNFTETLRGADAVIIADKDKAGRNHAQRVASKLYDSSRSVRVLELPTPRTTMPPAIRKFQRRNPSAEKLRRPERSE